MESNERAHTFLSLFLTHRIIEHNECLVWARSQFQNFNAQDKSHGFRDGFRHSAGSLCINAFVQNEKTWKIHRSSQVYQIIKMWLHSFSFASHFGSLQNDRSTLPSCTAVQTSVSIFLREAAVSRISILFHRMVTKRREKETIKLFHTSTLAVQETPLKSVFFFNSLYDLVTTCHNMS